MHGRKFETITATRSATQDLCANKVADPDNSISNGHEYISADPTERTKNKP